MSATKTEERCTFTFLWCIENFKCCFLTEDDVDSPSFSVLGWYESEWKLQIRLTQYDDCVTLSLVRINTFSDFVPICCEVSILNTKNNPPVFIEIARNKDINIMERLEFRMKKSILDFTDSSCLPTCDLTVRCRMWTTYRCVKYNGFCFARTVFSDIKLSILWPIRGFTTLELNVLKTNSIALASASGITFDLVFLLVGLSLTKARLKFQIVDVNIHHSKILQCKISIVDRKSGKLLLTCAEAKDKFLPSKVKETVIFPMLVTRQDVLASTCLDEDTLTLLCEYTILTGGYTGVIESTYYGTANLKENPRNHIPFVSTPSGQNQQLNHGNSFTIPERTQSSSLLQDDFLSLYKEHIFSDFELHSGDVSFPVHKNILSARSPVFRAMFSSDMKEANSKSLDILDIDAHTLNRTLTYLYTGTLNDLGWNAALKLYYAADKYQISSLKLECCSFLRSAISVKNVCEVLVLVDRHQDEELKSFAHEYVIRHFDETVSSPEWAKFLEREAQLAGITMHQVYLKKIQASKSQ